MVRLLLWSLLWSAIPVRLTTSESARGPQPDHEFSDSYRLWQSIPFLATSTGKDRVVLVYSDNIQVRSKKQQSNPAVDYNVHEEESNDVHVPVSRPRSSDHPLQELEGVALQSLSQCPPDAKTKNVPSAALPRRNSNSQSLTPSVIVNVPTAKAPAEPSEPSPAQTPASAATTAPATAPASTTAPTQIDPRPHIRISSL